MFGTNTPKKCKVKELTKSRPIIDGWHHKSQYDQMIKKYRQPEKEMSFPTKGKFIRKYNIIQLLVLHLGSYSFLN